MIFRIEHVNKICLIWHKIWKELDKQKIMQDRYQQQLLEVQQGLDDI